MRGFIVGIACLVSAVSVPAQSLVLDKVVAKVGKEYVLLSEVEERYALAAEKGKVPEGARCKILEELLVTNLLVHHAHIDSIEVPDAEVEDQLEKRISQILEMMGDDISQFETYYGMSISQAKELNRIDLRKRLNAQKVQASIMEGIKVTPAEVIDYFNEIPTDSLPFFNSEVEIAEIIYKPKINPGEQQKALDKINEIMEKLNNGEIFEDLARKYSDDLGSGRQGGSLGRNTRGTFVTEFEAAAYRLSKGELTDVVETQFGYHIIRLEGRWGDALEVSHILIRPKITMEDLDTAKAFLMDVRAAILSDSISFAQAVHDYSDEDAQSYSNNGRVTNPKTGNTFFETADLEHQIFFALDTVDVHGITGPIEFREPRGDIIYKLVELQSRTPPHQASMQKDYTKILNAAKQSKQNEAFSTWIDNKISETFILVDDFYNTCPNLEKWHVKSINRS
jgi:peptidyl-prolyl cis-trans isomerase SurA